MDRNFRIKDVSATSILDLNSDHRSIMCIVECPSKKKIPRRKFINDRKWSSAIREDENAKKYVEIMDASLKIIGLANLISIRDMLIISDYVDDPKF